MSKQQTNAAVVEAARLRDARKQELERFIHRCGIRSPKSKKGREAIERAATMKFETERERFARKEREMIAGLGRGAVSE